MMNATNDVVHTCSGRIDRSRGDPETPDDRLRLSRNVSDVTDTSDAELLDAIARNDREAWASLVRRHTNRLWAVARAQGLDRDRASDVVQSVWVKLIDNIGSIRQPEALSAWLATVVRNEAIGVSKRTSREDRNIDAEQFADAEADPAAIDTSLLLRERAAQVRSALSRLDPASRELLHLLFAEPPLSYAEIAQVTGMPVGSIGPTRARCLAKLRREL